MMRGQEPHTNRGRFRGDCNFGGSRPIAAGYYPLSLTGGASTGGSGPPAALGHMLYDAQE